MNTCSICSRLDPETPIDHAFTFALTVEFDDGSKFIFDPRCLQHLPWAVQHAQDYALQSRAKAIQMEVETLPAYR